MESACIEPENPIGDFHSSSINEQRPFKIVLKRSPTVQSENYDQRPSNYARDPTLYSKLGSMSSVPSVN